jgi:hypothetical protein
MEQQPLIQPSTTVEYAWSLGDFLSAQMPSWNFRYLLLATTIFGFAGSLISDPFVPLCRRVACCRYDAQQCHDDSFCREYDPVQTDVSFIVNNMTVSNGLFGDYYHPTSPDRSRGTKSNDIF